jgi:uncharacterized membrane-anchored protein YjiN (DUF445 family)
VPGRDRGVVIGSDTNDMRNTLSEQALSLRKMKVLATALLSAMAAIYLLSRLLEGQYPFLALAEAFSEAAMVGALADWFAVVALFRHPLGLPIPRTAIIPNNKERIGKSLEKFIRESFLSRDVIEKRLASTDLVGFGASRLADEANARRLAEAFESHLPTILDKLDDSNISEFLKEEIVGNIKKFRVSPVITAVLRPLAESTLHQNLLTELLRLAAHLLQENKKKLLEMAKKESPRYIPEFIDERIFNKISAKVEEVLAAVEQDREHELRAQFSEVLQAFLANLEDSEEYQSQAEKLKDVFLEDPNMKAYVSGFWKGLKKRLLSSAGSPSSETANHIARGLQELGRTLDKDTVVKEKINVWLRTVSAALISQNKDRLASLVSETVRKWDPEETSRRIELNVGKDLQWIRINGTVIGGLVGLLIYAISWLFRNAG